MRCLLALGLCVTALCTLTGCGDHKGQKSVKEPTDVVDHDFAVTIRKTSEPYVFEVEVKKVNPKADKKIGGPGGVVDLVLEDGSGKVFAADKPWEGPKYARELTKVFEWPRSSAVASMKGKVQLIRGSLPAGKYKVEPRARFAEVGKDRLHGPYPDGGTVAIPAANSVEIQIK